MKTASTALVNLLASRQFDCASLYTFNLANGGNLYYTSWDTDILYNGITYSSGGSTGPYFDCTDNKAKLTQNAGTQVDTYVVEVLPAQGLVFGQGFCAAIQQGVFAGAQLIYSGAYFPTGSGFSRPAVPTGTVIKMFGRVAEVDAGRTSAVFNVNSHLELLNQMMPKNLYQVGCTNTLYDAGCKLIQASFAINGSIGTGSSTNVLINTLVQSTGYFNMGTITFLTGANAGLTRNVKQYIQGSPSTMSVFPPFPNAVVNGDMFTVYPGCDKQQSTCQTKFGNLINFRGFPYVPVAETAV